MTTKLPATNALAENAVKLGYVKSVDEYNKATTEGQSGAKYGYTKESNGTVKANTVEQNTSKARKDAMEADTKLTKAQQQAQEREKKRAETKATTEPDTYEDNPNYTPEQNALAQSQKEQAKITQKLIDDQLTLNNQQSATSNSLIQNIKDTFANRIEEMKQTNQKQFQLETQVGLREGVGRARYAPKMQGQILTNEEQEGIGRVSKLETEMNELIIKAEQARDAKQMQGVQKIMELYSKKYKEQQDSILNLYKMTKESEEARIKKAKEERDAVEADFKLGTDKAKAVAPAVKDALDKLPNQAQKDEFITKYAEKMGISDPDYLYAALEEYGIKFEKEQLSMASTRNSMYNSNRSQNRADQAQNDKENAHLVDVENIIAGSSKLSDVDKGAKAKVIAELRDYGFYEENPPQWFVEMKESDGTMSNQQEILDAWKTYKDNALK